MDKKLKRSLKRNKGRILEVGKNNKELLFMDIKLRQTFPDKQKRIEYIDAVYSKLDESIKKDEKKGVLK